jgi:hypothetical protein
MSDTYSARTAGFTAARTAGLIAARTAGVIAARTAGFTAARIAGFTAARIAGFTAARIAGFTAARMAGFTAARMAGFTAARMAGFTDGDVVGVARIAFWAAVRCVMSDFFCTDIRYLLFRCLSRRGFRNRSRRRHVILQDEFQTAGGGKPSLGSVFLKAYGASHPTPLGIALKIDLI